MPPSLLIASRTVLTGTMPSPAASLSMELVDLIFETYITLYPKGRGKIATLSRPIRKRYRYPWSVEIYGSRPLLPASSPSPGKVVILRSQLERFLEDLSSFSSAFTDTLTFGEIENINIHLPFDNDAIVPPLRAAAKSLKRLKQVKFSAWVDVVDLEGFMRDVGRVGSGFAEATSLTLFFGAWDVTPLLSYQAWHRPFFLRNLSPYLNITSLKLRTALPMFPNPPANSEDSDAEIGQTRQDIALERANLQEGWLEKLRKKLPALTYIHLAESQDDNLGVGNWHYTRTRTLWYKTVQGWKEAEWARPGQDGLLGGWGRRRGRTTRKANFDAWGSDGEYSELDESGW